MENSTVTLTCKITKPGGKITWFKNGQKLTIKPKDKKYEVATDKLQTKLSLVIKGVNRDDQAEYSCQYEDDTTSANLIVEGLSDTSRATSVAIVKVHDMCYAKITLFTIYDAHYSTIQYVLLITFVSAPR